MINEAQNCCSGQRYHYKYNIGGILWLICALLSGCASYPCGEPSMGKCASVTDNYQSSFTDYKNSDDLPKNDSGEAMGDSSVKGFNFIKYAQVPVAGAPLVSQPTMMRVWLTPYTDNDYIYHGQGYEYILTSKGHWLYSNNNFNANQAIKNISLVQGTIATYNGYDSNSTAAPTKTGNATSTSTNPNNMLSDYPAFNALKNQSIPNRITTGTTTIYNP